MSLIFVLMTVFLSVSLIGYTMINSSTSAWGEYSSAFNTSTESNLRKLFLFADTRKLFVAYLTSFILVPGVLYVLDANIIVIVVSVIALYMAPRLMFSWLAERRKRKINEALPDGLALIAGAMRAGSTFSTAIQALVEEQDGPLGQELSLLIREQRVGARMEEALDNLAERVQTEEMDLFVSAAMIAQEVGGNLSEILQRLSETIRRKLEMEGKIKALTAQGVLQGRVVTALPFMIMLALFFVEPEATRPLFSSLLGWIFLTVILILQVVGGLMIRKIVRINV